MKREYITLTRRKCWECGDRLEYNTCWPQNIPHTSVGWGYFYCSNQTCREHTRPKDKHDLSMGANAIGARRTDTLIDWTNLK